MKKPDLLPRNEWDFSSLRDEEVAGCHHWEFSRTAVLEKNPCFVNDPAQWADGSGLLADTPYPPPWPHAPFQSLDHEARKEIADAHSPLPAMHPFPLDGISDWIDSPSGESAWPLDSGPVLAAFTFDPHRSHKAIVEGFSTWLAAYLKENSGEVIEARGRNADQSQCKIALASLGILRIIRNHDGVTIEGLIRLYGDFLPPRFSEAAAWSREKSRALTFLRGWQQMNLF